MPRLPFSLRMLQPRKAFYCSSITLGIIGASMKNEGGSPLTPARGFGSGRAGGWGLTLETEVPSWRTEDSKPAWVT